MTSEKRHLTSKKFLVLNETTILRLKKKAKSYKKAEHAKNNKVTQTEALNYIAKKENFDSWRHLISTKDYEQDNYEISYSSQEDGDFCQYDCHTTKQLIGSISRGIDIPVYPFSPIIQLAIPESCLNANAMKTNHYLFESYLIRDSYLELYLSEETTYFESRVDLVGGMHFLRLLHPDMYTHSEVYEYTEDFFDRVGRFDNDACTDFIWINGKSSKYMQQRALHDADGFEEEIIDNQSYFNLPEECWKADIY